ncbi:MAG: maleylpyruvate isomerase N-terminal domain-containing protein [Micromonospora sp.]
MTPADHVRTDPSAVREALLCQWRRLAEAVSTLDLCTPTRVAGWTNGELVAHLAAQPLLLTRFLAGVAPPTADVTLEVNLSETGALAAAVDRAARTAARTGRLDLAGNIDRAVPALLAADLGRTVGTLRGAMALADYLVTRCVEAVVHGLDLVPPVAPDPRASAIAAQALRLVLRHRAPRLVPLASELDDVEWLELATGRRPASAALADVLPLLT